METWLTIGKITGVHGLGGNLKVWSYAQSPDTFAKGHKVRLQDEDGSQAKAYTIAKVSIRKKGILLSLEAVSTRETAQDLVGKEILIDKNELPDLDEDTWYWEDLFNLRVKDSQLGDLGVIDRIFPTGADDILVVTDKKDKSKEILIPMNQHFVDEVDVAGGWVKTSLPSGFILE